MPITITPETPRKLFTVAGISLEVPEPFNEGHVLTANEAKVLNQTYAENIRNNTAPMAKKAIADANDVVTDVDKAALQAKIDEYVASYEFGVRAAGTGEARIVDPIEKEANRLGKQIVKDALKAKGIKFTDVSTEKFNSLVKQVLDSANGEKIYKEAKRAVDARNKTASIDLDLGDLQGGQA
jgi:hypothetical protein